MRGRVLVVDDEPLIAKAVRRILGGAHEVQVAASAAEVLERLSQGERYDVILSDIMMPEMDGVQLAERIGALDREQGERVVFLTGTHPESLPEGLAARCLSKPFSMEELRSVVGRFVG